MEKTTKEQINIFLWGVRRKDKDSLNSLYDIIAPHIRFIALKYMRNKYDADDLVQDFWANIYKIAAGFIVPYNGFGYLCRAMNHMAINRCKKLNREISKSVEFIDFKDLCCDDSGLQFELIERNKMLDDAISQLTENERIIIQLTFFEDKTVRTIAKELHISKSYVSKLKLAALGKLKEQLEKW